MEQATPAEKAPHQQFAKLTETQHHLLIRSHQRLEVLRIDLDTAQRQLQEAYEQKFAAETERQQEVLALVMDAHSAPEEARLNLHEGIIEVPVATE